MLNQIVNRLQGQVRIRVETPFPERVLNLCGARNLAFWDMEWESETAFTCRLNRRDYYALRRAVKQLDCRQAGAPDPQHAAGGVYVDLLVAVRQDACVVLQIQLAAAHHLQVGQARHQICRQVEQLRHRVQHAAVSVLSIPLHTFTSSRLYAQTSRNMPGA